MENTDFENRSAILDLIDRIPLGSSKGLFEGRTYLVTKTAFNDERSFKVFAEELGGKEFVSANVYVTSSGVQLKPCEMADEKVITFLSEVEILTDHT